MAQLIIPNENTGSDRAELAWIEQRWQQPVQRVFWLSKVPQHVSRGGHHHRSCRMILHCVTGSVKVYVQTPKMDQYFTLNSTQQYLSVDAQDWRLMYQFSADALLVVFADKPFETTVYIDPPYRSIQVDPAITLPTPKQRKPQLPKIC